jgi:hypothetical protein
VVGSAGAAQPLQEKALTMPATGYDDDAMRIGSVRSGTHSWWFKLAMLALFVCSIGIGAGMAWLFK